MRKCSCPQKTRQIPSQTHRSWTSTNRYRENYRGCQSVGVSGTSKRSGVEPGIAASPASFAKMRERLPAHEAGLHVHKGALRNKPSRLGPFCLRCLHRSGRDSLLECLRKFRGVPREDALLRLVECRQTERSYCYRAPVSAGVSSPASHDPIKPKLSPPPTSNQIGR